MCSGLWWMLQFTNRYTKHWINILSDKTNFSYDICGIRLMDGGSIVYWGCHQQGYYCVLTAEQNQADIFLVHMLPPLLRCKTNNWDNLKIQFAIELSPVSVCCMGSLKYLLVASHICIASAAAAGWRQTCSLCWLDKPGLHFASSLFSQYCARLLLLLLHFKYPPLFLGSALHKFFFSIPSS